MKHLLRTASFAKKFLDHNEYDANKYVGVVKNLIVLSKIRYKGNCKRAITYKQFDKFKPKNTLKLLLHHRDFALAIKMIELLNMTGNLPLVYEKWASTMLIHSRLSHEELKERLQNKFEELARRQYGD